VGLLARLALLVTAQNAASWFCARLPLVAMLTFVNAALDVSVPVWSWTPAEFDKSNRL